MKAHSLLGISVSVAAIAAAGYLFAQDSSDDKLQAGWTVSGQNITNLRFQPSEHEISSQNVASLTPQWTFTTGGDVSATPVVAGGTLYAPDWQGNLYAIRAATGQLRWSHKISDYDGFAGAIFRNSPAVNDGDLIIGDVQDPSKPHNGANVMAINRNTGVLRWMTQVESHLSAQITGSPVVFRNTIYVSVSSNEEGLADQPGYPCCTFRGSIVALDESDGHILWKTYVVPDNHGQTGEYSGGAIWQPPAIDSRRGVLYVGTGNNYTVPQSVENCEAAALALGNTGESCVEADDYFDTAMALDLETGKIKWSKMLRGYDVWTVACIQPKAGVSCPSPAGPDYDLGGSGPNLLPNMVGFGQKSGMYWALNPDTGAILWSTMVGPGGTLGGIEWGTASDGQSIYAAIANNSHTSYTLANGGPTITGGSWAALNPSDGRVLWQTADPTGAIDPGSVSVANGVVYAGSFSGNMHALDARTGKILFTFTSGGSVIDGPAIVNGTVFWGSGYAHISPGTGNNRIFAFSLPGGNRQNRDR